MRRDELYDSSSDAGSGSHVDAQDDDAEVRAKMNERLAGLLGLDLAAPAPAASSLEQQNEDGGGDDDDHKQDEEFEFRLFSTSSKTAVPAKVVLAASDDEDAPHGEGGFTVPVRPTSYYVAARPTPEQLEMYRWAATSGQDILLGARKRAWGLERPWRLVRLKVPRKSLAGLDLPPADADAATAATPQATLGHANEDDEQQTAVKRKRPGKKRRIASRIKAKAEKEKREAEEKNKMSKEEHLKEKKKRLNREKKLKRRAKEKEKKLATQADEGGMQPVSSESDDGSAA